MGRVQSESGAFSVGGFSGYLRQLLLHRRFGVVGRGGLPNNRVDDSIVSGVSLALPHESRLMSYATRSTGWPVSAAIISWRCGHADAGGGHRRLHEVKGGVTSMGARSALGTSRTTRRVPPPDGAAGVRPRRPRVVCGRPRRLSGPDNLWGACGFYSYV